MGQLTTEDWQAYKDVINEFHEDAFQHNMTWKKLVTNLNFHGEDGADRFEDHDLKCLVSYNYFRSWPMNKAEKTGEIDQESVLVYINLKYLDSFGFLNEHNQFEFDPVNDRFILQGLWYKTSGDAQVAQAGVDPLLHFLILKREEIQSHETKY